MPMPHPNFARSLLGGPAVGCRGGPPCATTAVIRLEIRLSGRPPRPEFARSRTQPYRSTQPSLHSPGRRRGARTAQEPRANRSLGSVQDHFARTGGTHNFMKSNWSRGMQSHLPLSPPPSHWSLLKHSSRSLDCRSERPRANQNHTPTRPHNQQSGESRAMLMLEHPSLTRPVAIRWEWNYAQTINSLDSL